MTRALSRKLHEAKASKRMSLPTPEYPYLLDYKKPIKEITVKDFRNGETNVLTLYHCRKRKDMWRVTINGLPWKDSIGYSNIMAAIRKSR
jgi:hypothetical protein